MINTLEKIGEIIKNDTNGRIKFHPLFKTLEKETPQFDKKGVLKKPKKTFQYFKVNVNTLTKKVELINDGEELPFESCTFLKYDIGGKYFPYLIGNYEILDLAKARNNKISMCSQNNIENLNNIIIERKKEKISNEEIENIKKYHYNKMIYDYSIIINDNMSIFDTIISKKIAESTLIINITINNKEFYEYSEIMDYIDKLYLGEITMRKNGNIILKNSLFSFFKTSPKQNMSQSPNFSFVDSYKSFNLSMEKLNNLLYSVKFHENNTKYVCGDYVMKYLPKSDSLTYKILEKQFSYKKGDVLKIVAKEQTEIKEEISDNEPIEELLKGDDIFNFGIDCKDFNIKDNVIFDIIFKLNGGKTTNDILYLSNFHISNLEKLNNKIINIRKILSEDNMRYDTSIKYSFENFFKKAKSRDCKEYSSFIFNWIIEIFQDRYYRNNLIDDMFIEKVGYCIRNTEYDNIKYEYNRILTNYNFLRLMEKNSVVKLNEETNTQTYILGEKVGKYCQVWQNDRKNIKKYVNIFNGFLSNKINKISDVCDYLSDMLQRLERNDSYFDKSEFTNINIFVENFSENFDKKLFIRGYLKSQYYFVK